MILVDFSSIIHRMVFASSKDVQPKEINGKYITSEYAELMLDYIMTELINIQMKHQLEYGEMIILFDDWKKDYWRKDIYSAYKGHRGAARAKTKINYSEVYEYVNNLADHLINDTPWRCITVNRAEADDTILVLSREFSKREKILIYSPDKDFIQAQRFTDNVDQYSPLTKKWLKATDKYDNAEHWQLEHIMLGDSSDGVPKVVDHCEFSESFLLHLKEHSITECTPHEFRETDKELKLNALTTFTVQKKNRKNEDIGLDVYKDTRFGSSTLKKAIENHGTLDNFLDSHPLYREHYERNFTLVMEEGIPEDIWAETMNQFNLASTKYNVDSFNQYLVGNHLLKIQMELPKVFKNTEELSLENCGW